MARLGSGLLSTPGSCMHEFKNILEAGAHRIEPNALPLPFNCHFRAGLLLSKAALGLWGCLRLCREQDGTAKR